MLPVLPSRRAVAAWRLAFIGLTATASSFAQSQVQISMAAPEAAPRLNGARVAGIRKSTPFLHRLAATGEAPLTFGAQNLPAGLRLNAQTGVISGSAATEGSFVVPVTVSNAAGKAEGELRIVVGEELALTPPIGWNSYDSFDDAVTEAEVIAQATWLRDHLQPFGWDTVVVDFRWYDPDAPASDQGGNGAQLILDANGRYVPAPKRFPKGFKALGEQIHAMGLKFGIHIMRGIPRRAVNDNLPIAGSTFKAKDAVRATTDNGYTCVWNADMYGVKGDTPAGQAWYDSIFAQYADYGIDFVKVDDTTKNRPANAVEYFKTEVEAIQNAIHKSGRSIVLSLSPGEALKDQAAHIGKWANLWRMSDDYWDRYADLEHMFMLAQRWAEVGGAGHWPDADMLPLSHLGPHCPVDGTNRSTRFTKNEQQLMMSLWATLPSPYFLGANLVESESDAFFLGLVQNPEIIDVHQDGGGKKAKRVAAEGDAEVWSRELSGGKLLVGFFNRGDADAKQRVELSKLGVTEKRLVRDPWQRKELAAVTGTDALEATVPNHASALFVLSPEAPPPGSGGSGAGGSAGSSGTAGSDASAGNPSAGGVAASGAGGLPTSTAGAPSGAGAGGASVAGATTGSSSAPSSDDGGCGCRFGSTGKGGGFALVLMLLFASRRAARRDRA